MPQRPFAVICAFAVLAVAMLPAQAQVKTWQREWPNTDFSRASVDFEDIMSGGPPKDGIPAIDRPRFRPVSAIDDLAGSEPVIAVSLNGEAKAYPLRILTWHEIANDEIGGVPVAVTYCPLCNASIVFDRRLDGTVYDFGVSGKLRNSDMIMYDRQTESWWQQFVGEAIVGEMTGARLAKIPSRIVPFSVFAADHPQGRVLVPPRFSNRPYGDNPYVRYDAKGAQPFLYDGRYRGPVPALAYVVAVGAQAWPLADIRAVGRLEQDDLVITWHEGMNSALDKKRIAKGRDIGYVEVRRRLPDGCLEPAIYDMTFAFAFKAFYPDGQIHRVRAPDSGRGQAQ
ncbi:MAG: DUF3179 domain-containing protein [Alphaproteobacteria bacterium]|nr:MAG: DUF3179 domain-containing protein [Alphaproteobacteria bacterium]